MRVKTDSVVSRNGNDSVTFLDEVSFPPTGKTNVQGNINISGVSTVGFLTTSNANMGIITATSLIGNGSELTNVPTVTISRSFALKLIISDPPLRS